MADGQGAGGAALPNLKADEQALDALEDELFALRYAQAEIDTFASVIDPPGAGDDRAQALALLAEREQGLLASSDTGALLGRLSAHAGLLGARRSAQIRVLSRDHVRAAGVPAKEQGDFVRLADEAQRVWLDAKRHDDWASFEPYLQRLVDAKVRMAQLRSPGSAPYDVCLDDFEHGADQAFYDRFFAQVKDCVVPLLQDVMLARRRPGRDCVAGAFDEARQWALARDLAALEGVDERRFWLGSTEHAFTGGPGRGFVVVAGHVERDDVLSGVFTMLHEGGHALYEQGVDASLSRTSLAGGTSSAMHESQSRLFENLVGRSRAFAGPLLATMRRHFQGQLGRVTPTMLYLAENVVEPSLVRTDADELTYPLHVLVRYEIEQALLAGEAKASDVPGLWAEKYRAYLGVRVPDDTHGALQDIHWACGEFGYFPTYALGNAYASQLVAAMVRDGVDFEGACAAGDLSPVSGWLGERVWRWGRAKDSAEILELTCHEAFEPRYYTDYLRSKFSAIYQLGA